MNIYLMGVLEYLMFADMNQLEEWILYSWQNMYINGGTSHYYVLSLASWTKLELMAMNRCYHLIVYTGELVTMCQHYIP